MTNPTSRRWQPARPAGVPAPAGAYSPAVRAGDFVFVSGQVPKDPATGQVVGDTVADQTARVLQNLALALEGAGAALTDVVSVAVHLANVDDWGAFDVAYRRVFAEPFPTRTVVGAALRGILVEITAVAYVGPATAGLGASGAA
jgi:2-iminobutanoate/2-iminopropanoate deaminase